MGKRIAASMIVCAAGWLTVASVPASASTHPHPKVPRAALACVYQVGHVRPSSYLNVRLNPSLRSHRIGKLKVADGFFAGACQPVRNWVAVKSSCGKPGWASAKYLVKLNK
ncbi:hypothetical protein GCM10009555_101780 [Acrocarpospora macrocephala]|uniref:SH3b domain-containing protein n=1 Tax=Acrocarpospora macrocephala TaxID=150177 RepID=A0A5M3WG60_9ACTN|nr:SH3 domain-containing protein [Acrocarpospora macrocephala]GES07102.1 hypothetical protein Amac_006970 [Acrocarpospora macrocephala]